MGAKARGRLGKTLGLLIGTGAIIVVLLWLMGAFRDVQPPGEPQDVLRHLPEGAQTLVVHEATEAVYESAVGTISPVQKVRVGSKLLARVESMRVSRAGERVTAGQVLAVLDSQELESRVLQAEAAHEAATARLSQAQVDLERVRRLYEKRVESKDKLDQASTAVRTAQADATRVGQTVEHARAQLKYATIRAPIAGMVIDKQVEEGDLVSPGQVLVTLYDPGRMQLIARVREGLTAGLEPGSTVGVRIDALDMDCEGRIDQIVPEAEAASRVFEVKVSGPCPPGVFSGMFGRLRVPVGSRTVLRVPDEAIRRVGQVETVYVVIEGDRLLRRFVQTGGRDERGVEVLAGLVDGERILAEAGGKAP